MNSETLHLIMEIDVTVAGYIFIGFLTFFGWNAGQKVWDHFDKQEKITIICERKEDNKLDCEQEEKK